MLGDYILRLQPHFPEANDIKIFFRAMSSRLSMYWYPAIRWWYPVGAHDDVIKWKHFLRYWPFMQGIHRSPVNSPHKGQWRGASMFSLICVWINGWVNNREAGDLRRYRAHYDVNVMIIRIFITLCPTIFCWHKMCIFMFVYIIFRWVGSEKQHQISLSVTIYVHKTMVCAVCLRILLTN